MSQLVDEFGNLLTPSMAAWLMGGLAPVRLLGQRVLIPVHIPGVVYGSMTGREVWFDEHGWMHTKERNGHQKKELVEY